MDFAPPKCLEFPVHQWWRPATEIPVGEDENPLPFLHIKFRPWGKKDGEKQLHRAVNKGRVSIKTLSVWRERAQPTGWRNKEKLMGSYIWHVQAQLDPGAYTKPFNICLFLSFSSGFPLCSLHSWAICLCGGFSSSRPKTYQKENFSPYYFPQKSPASCFGSDLVHKPTADPLPVARVVEYTEWLR